MVARFSGIVTYSDGSKGQFAGHLDERGLVSLNDQSDGQINIINALSGEAWMTEMIMALDVSGTSVIPPDLATTKTVTDLTAELSGHVAYDDGTHGGFITQYTHKTGAYIPSGGDVANWERALGNVTLLNNLMNLFEEMAPGSM